jgi:hypothetical protein
VSARVAAAAALLLLACAAVPRDPDPPPRFAPVERFANGLVFLASASGSLEDDTRVTVVSTASPQRVLHARISCRIVAHPASGPEATPGFLSSPFLYELLVEGSDDGAPLLGVAVVGAGALRVMGNRVRGDLDGDGRDECFFECTSGEGVHLSVRGCEEDRGAPARWSWYHYLGYDTEPTCAE